MPERQESYMPPPAVESLQPASLRTSKQLKQIASTSDQGDSWKRLENPQSGSEELQEWQTASSRLLLCHQPAQCPQVPLCKLDCERRGFREHEGRKLNPELACL